MTSFSSRRFLILQMKTRKAKGRKLLTTATTNVMTAENLSPEKANLRSKMLMAEQRDNSMYPSRRVLRVVL
jgi:hypothetical protein